MNTEKNQRLSEWGLPLEAIEGLSERLSRNSLLVCRPRSACGRSTNKARLGLPAERSFATKLELALRVVDRLQANDVPFEAVDCDSLSGRKGWLRDQ